MPPTGQLIPVGWPVVAEIDRAKSVGLPPRPFLYTLDQISQIVSVDIKKLRASYIYFERRTIGHKETFLMTAHNIAPTSDTPEWRVSERELVRWLKYMGYKYYDRGYASD